MKTAIIIGIICDSIWAIAIITSLIMYFRIKKSSRLVEYMIALVHEYNSRQIDRVRTADIEELVKMLSQKNFNIPYIVIPDLSKIAFSFKKITLENWLDKKTLDKLLYGDLNDVLKQNKIAIK